MAKSPETYDKVAATFTKKADRMWADAKNGGHPDNYNHAKSAYATADKARAAADDLRKKK